MKIDHIAIWVHDIEKVCSFYQKYLGGNVQPEYQNTKKGFASRFITFSDGARLEVMHRGDIGEVSHACEHFGWAHVCFNLGSKENVDKLTHQMESDGIAIAGQPRTTGDGYYESVVLDPEGNRVELTA